MSSQEGAFFYLGTSPHEEHEDQEAARLGMWMFLLTELLLFGALFLAYSVYRSQYLNDFHNVAKKLDTTIGTINTLILLFSSLTVVISIVAVRKGNKMLAVAMMVVTILCGLAFLVIKSFEWKAKFEHGMYLMPGIFGEQSPDLLALPHGEQVFYGLYFIMTGLHALHVIIGMVLLSVITVFIVKDIVHKKDVVFLENSGLYWHIVDLIWIFLFPLYYLIA